MTHPSLTLSFLNAYVAYKLSAEAGQECQRTVQETSEGSEIWK